MAGCRFPGRGGADGGGADAFGGTGLVLPRPSGRPPWRLIISPLPHALTLDLPAGGRARVPLAMSDPERIPVPSAAQLRGLTSQEAPDQCGFGIDSHEAGADPPPNSGRVDAAIEPRPRNRPGRHSRSPWSNGVPMPEKCFAY